MLEEQTLNHLSCVVVDEVHMVGDADRGYQLELLLTKLRCAGQTGDARRAAGHCDAASREHILRCTLRARLRRRAAPPDTLPAQVRDGGVRQRR